MSRALKIGHVKLPQDLGTVALRVVLTEAPDRNLLGLRDRRLRQLDNAVDSKLLHGTIVDVILGLRLSNPSGHVAIRISAERSNLTLDLEEICRASHCCCWRPLFSALSPSRSIPSTRKGADKAAVRPLPYPTDLAKRKRSIKLNARSATHSA